MQVAVAVMKIQLIIWLIIAIKLIKECSNNKKIYKNKAKYNFKGK